MKMSRSWSWLAVIMLLVCVISVDAFAQLTAARDTPTREGIGVGIGVASNTTIYAGAMVAINSSGYAVPAADTAGFKVVGRAEATVVNSGSDGAVIVVVRRGVFRWINGDTFTRADVGTLAYVEDDATVQKAASATHNICAGTIVDVDLSGVWVDTYTLGSHGSATIVNLTASGDAAITGDATVGGTLGVTGNTTAGGTLAVTGAATLASRLHFTPVANASVTNGQAVTLSGVINLLTAAESANANTNTVTLANPTATGQYAIIYNSAAATNLLAVAKTGNFDGPALELGAGESAILFAPSGTKWAGIGQ